MIHSVVTPHSARLNYCCVPQHVKAKPSVLRSLDMPQLSAFWSLGGMQLAW
ncbi:hypothetical protein [Candidatus Nitrotoga sp. M5]|uniref:hypothetical protein n=1 Tax=Candidatus Nitrotoga sp. M5 TaxID=2890409 RepID=UPI001EF20890|nr:hypothetical protein [Candidatus Nitrotoga sp. M5]